MSRPRTGRQRVHVMLTTFQIRAVRALSKKSGYPVSEIMRRAVDMYLKKALSNEVSSSNTGTHDS